jgi:prepilin-type N-terminal cleavage/methylation domain-containing protein
MARAPSPGFTLLELMIAVAILVLLAALAAPSLSDFFDRNRVRAAADDVSSLISHARAEAVKNDVPVRISMAGSGTAWCVGCERRDATDRRRQGRQRGRLRLHADHAVHGRGHPAGGDVHRLSRRGDRHAAGDIRSTTPSARSSAPTARWGSGP